MTKPEPTKATNEDTNPSNSVSLAEVIWESLQVDDEIQRDLAAWRKKKNSNHLTKLRDFLEANVKDLQRRPWFYVANCPQFWALKETRAAWKAAPASLRKLRVSPWFLLLSNGPVQWKDIQNSPLKTAIESALPTAISLDLLTLQAKNNGTIPDHFFENPFKVTTLKSRDPEADTFPILFRCYHVAERHSVVQIHYTFDPANITREDFVEELKAVAQTLDFPSRKKGRKPLGDSYRSISPDEMLHRLQPHLENLQNKKLPTHERMNVKEAKGVSPGTRYTQRSRSKKWALKVAAYLAGRSSSPP